MAYGIGGISRGPISSAPIGAGPPFIPNYSLSATGIATPAPLVCAPSLTSGANYSLTATGIATPAPLVDSPAGTQDQVLSASGIVTGAPVVDSPVALNGINYSITANGVAAGSPIVDAPTGGYTHPRPPPKTKHLPRYRSVRCHPFFDLLQLFPTKSTLF